MIRMTSAALITILAASSGSARAADDGGKAAASIVADNSGVTVFAAEAETAPRLRLPIVVPARRAAVPTRGRMLPILYVNYVALQTYDGYSTINGVKRGAREVNPMMSSLAGNPAAVWAVKGGVTAASILVAERLWKQHRRRHALVTMIVSNGLMAAVAARNASVLRAQR